jgi:NAD(P)-dependent dehydrogenase (short-subunit alcohol dehydrogenase family)
VVFNNAGVAAAGPAWLATLEDWKWVLDVNLMGVVHGIRAFVPAMIARGRPARVVNTASIAGLVSPPGLAVYAASKHAVVSLSECLAHDLAMARAPVGVTVLCPGYVRTGIAHAFRNRPAELAATNPLAPVYGAKIAEVVAAATITAAEIAAAVIQAVRDEVFYVLTHPGCEADVHARLTAIEARGAPAIPTMG